MATFNIPTMAVVPAVFLASGAIAAPRDVQIREINFETQIVTLHNYGATDEPLAAYRFCTHDEDQAFRYSLAFGAFTIEAGTDFFVHWLNDSPGGGDNVNISDIGGNFAVPLDNTAWAMEIYFPPVNFGVAATMADHLQWNVDGIDNEFADARSSLAEDGGLWTDQEAWIATTSTSVALRLNDAAGGQLLHGPGDYTTFSPIEGDINGDFVVDTADLGFLISVFGTNNEAADFNDDMIVDTADLGTLIANFGAISP